MTTLDQVDITIASIIHHLSDHLPHLKGISLRLLNKAFAYVALKRPELAEHVVVGEHGYVIEGWRERLARLEAVGLVRIVGSGK